jgi:FMN phosphatase YigB (HAD superfamily)
MPSAGAPASVPIEGVIFDLHHTLIDPGEPGPWLDLAWAQLNRAGTAAETLDAGRLESIYHVLDRVWDLAHAVDPTSRRDLDPETHERVFHTVLGDVAGDDHDLAGALYETLLDTWHPYEDTLPVLEALRERGCPVAVLSNVGIDVRPVLERTGILPLVAGLALSYEVGAVKPERAIFIRALELIGVPADRALMVGDSFRDDAAAAALDIRTLILPRTRGAAHGLGSVLRLIG